MSNVQEYKATCIIYVFGLNSNSRCFGGKNFIS